MLLETSVMHRQEGAVPTDCPRLYRTLQILTTVRLSHVERSCLEKD